MEPGSFSDFLTSELPDDVRFNQCHRALKTLWCQLHISRHSLHLLSTYCTVVQDFPPSLPYFAHNLFDYLHQYIFQHVWIKVIVEYFTYIYVYVRNFNSRLFEIWIKLVIPFTLLWEVVSYLILTFILCLVHGIILLITWPKQRWFSIV